MDLAAVKAELKTWEREFKSQNGRDPSKADIKAVPETAEKYRLYSKARADKPSSTSVPSKPRLNTAPAAAPPPVTPSKRAAGQRQQQDDSFKTPSRSSAVRANGSARIDAGNGEMPSQSPTANGNTQFAYAPSPSRLRALAASRSFSGSPNKKGGLAALEEARSTIADAPANLGKSFVLPPTVDTPRTKAKRWLAGDAVSPPVKLRYNAMAHANAAPQASTSGTQPSARRGGRSKADFWQQVEQRRSATPTASAEEASTHLPVVAAYDMMEEQETTRGQLEDEDLLAPSPVKPAAGKASSKGKQRQRIDLFGSFTTESGNNDSINGKSNASLPLQKLAPTPITSFFSAKPGLSRSSLDISESDKRPYLPGPSKARKRTIAAAAIIPAVSADFDKIEEPDVAPVQAADATQKPKGRNVKEPKAIREEADQNTVGPSDRTKRPRKGIETSKFIESDAAMQEADSELYDDAFDAEFFETIEAQQDDNYETRDLSDEYEDYTVRHSAKTVDISLRAARETSSAPLDESLDPDLVSMLSLKASPVKNRLSRLCKKREDTYRKLLNEPTYILETKRRITGLEDLEEDEQRKREADLDAKRSTEPEWTADILKEDELGLPNALDGQEEEQSDDDWASEPEGWKDLSDGEMPDDSF